LKQNILFLINPVSGGKNKLQFPEMVSKYLDREKFHADHLFTKGPGHAYDLVTGKIKSDTDIFVAVGGDGTINEVASALSGSDRRMGIIPCGSGNGLARSLNIPMRDKQAILRLNDLNTIRIDSGRINGRKFFNMAGIGFDAHISAVFAGSTHRGLGGYVKTTLSELRNYQSQQYDIEVDGQNYSTKAFMISIANSPQYGNNAHISPFASLDDGFLDLCIIKPFPLYHFPAICYRMFDRSTHRSKYVEIIRAKNIRILRDAHATVHVDGEPVQMEKELNIGVKPLSLSVLI
jgi:diacylglycerol kinase (ATP)